MKLRSIWVAGAAAAFVVGAPQAAFACPDGGALAGVVQRVVSPEDILLQRPGRQAGPPAPMEMLCEGDVLSARVQSAVVTYRLEGSAESTVLRGPSQVTMPRGRRGATVVDNALQILMDNWMPELRRSSNFGVTRGNQRQLEPAAWAVSGVDTGAAVLRRTTRPLYLRWTGGKGPFQAEILRTDGVRLDKVQTTKTEVRFAARRWTNGTYTLRVYGAPPTPGAARPLVLDGSFRVADGPPAAASLYPPSVGPELRAASDALRLAGEDKERWSLEALQMIDSAPAQGLDREAIYDTFTMRSDH